MDNKSRIKTELLAPAGNMDCLKAAVIAGADAIYLAGKRFGARASADNFDDEELISALDFVHTYDRKIYLTLNTLIKEREWSDIYGFLMPLYKAGLDGIIIQDLGLVRYLKEQFPELPLHASTQMTVTHSLSAELLKELGICRVVTARELSLAEIAAIKNETGLEIEVFIHGAMCYSYSGACLFSSFLGGRSGNRGRCAGPCRLPYNKGEYPLSMRDLCLVRNIPDLIDSGADSFKIEGRLKSPEYVTGVTRIYRKVIDGHLGGTGYTVTNEDLEELDSLYLRGGRSTGYLFTHNSADMITLENPSYNGPSKAKETELKEWSADRDIRMSVSAEACFHVKQPMSLTLKYDNDVIVTVTGDAVEEATGRPATADDVKNRLSKTGGTPYVIDELDLELDDNCFLPVSSLNELRRRAVDELTELRLEKYKRSVTDSDEDISNFGCALSRAQYEEDQLSTGNIPDISLMSVDQLKTVLSSGQKPARIYVPFDLIYSEKLTDGELDALVKDLPETEVFLSLPRIYRSSSDEYMNALLEMLFDESFVSKCRIGGVLVKNLEELKMFTDRSIELRIIADHSIYVWNKNSLKQVLEYADEVTLPLELNLHEIEDEISSEYADRLNMVIYGRAPLMVSANCINRTHGKCSGDVNGFINGLTDRYGKKEPVYCNCLHCYNEIFNALPTSYHKKINDIRDMSVGRLRIDLTDEPAETIKKLMGYYSKEQSVFPVEEYTSGHMDKGAI